MSKNPDMQESTAWAVATQQSHAAGKSPKGYGTSEGRSEAKQKFDKPKKEYMQTANPKLASAIDGYSLAVFSGFSSEMQKIGGRFGEAAKTFGHYLMGGPKKDLVAQVALPQNRLAKKLGNKPGFVTAHIPGAGPRTGGGISAIRNPTTREDALKVVGARGTAGAATLGLGAAASKHHQQSHNKQLEEAYMSGAKDMYAQGQGK